MDKLSQAQRLIWNQFVTEFSTLSSSEPYLAILAGDTLELRNQFFFQLQAATNYPLVHFHIHSPLEVNESLSARYPANTIRLMFFPPMEEETLTNSLLRELVLRRDRIVTDLLMVVCIWDLSTHQKAYSHAGDFVHFAQFVGRFEDYPASTSQDTKVQLKSSTLEKALEQSIAEYQGAIRKNAPTQQLTNSALLIADQALESDQYDLAGTYYQKAWNHTIKIQDRVLISTVANRYGLFLQDRGAFQQAEAMFEQSYKNSQVQADQEGIAISLINRGNVRVLQGDWDDGRQDLVQAVAISRKYQLRTELARALNNLAILLIDLEEPQEALPLLKEALRIDEQMNWREDQATDLGNIGLVYDLLGAYDLAITNYRKALTIFQELKDIKGQANQLGNLGTIARSQGNYDEALKYHLAALELDQKGGFLPEQAADLSSIGLVYYQQGDLPVALDYFQQALEIDRKVGSRKGIAQSMGNIGLVYHEMGQLEKALTCQQEVYAINQELGYEQGQAEDLVNIGMLYLDLGQTTKALEHLHQALKLDEKLGHQSGMASTLNNLGLVYTKEEQYQEAERYFKKSLALKRELDLLESQADSLGNLGTVALRQGQFQKARKYWLQSIEIYEQLDSALGMATMAFNLGELHLAKKEYDECLDYFGQAERLFRKWGYWNKWKQIYPKLVEACEQKGDERKLGALRVVGELLGY